MRRTRTICLPQAVGADVYATLETTLAQSRGEDLVIDATYVQTLDARCAELLRQAIKAWAADRRLLSVVKGVGGAPATLPSAPEAAAA